MTQVLERTVLFADLRGSTGMYESLGNTDATAVVTRSVSLLARVVQAHGGQVVKTLGDGLMAVFDAVDSSVAAADEMHDAMTRIGVPDELAAARESPTLFPGAAGTESQPATAVPLKLQIGIAHGEIVEMSGDVFGDAVNVAARLLDHAGDNETLATLSVVEKLDDWERSRFRNLDRMQLRGRAEPVHVYLQEAIRRFGDTAATAFGDMAPATSENDGIRLIWVDVNRIFAGTSLPVVLGRSPQATYIIDDNRVSRSHARIDWHGGTFQLVDLSYNGTYVRFDNDPEIISLRRGSCTLHGAGLIGLGTPPSEPQSPCVRFEVMRFADTHRQAPFEFTIKP
ncbi:MAG: adenylate/guanylate cyclase domain-containing protein [Pseudomonadota bacterium]|nr:adenylate/guanylate cyclase domain-containing protein [Pseudomonadota bacterium]